MTGKMARTCATREKPGVGVREEKEEKEDAGFSAN